MIYVVALLLVLLRAGLLLTPSFIRAGQNPARPNIVVIMTDDQDYASTLAPISLHI